MHFPSPTPYPSQCSAVLANNMVVASHLLAAAITLTMVDPTGNGIGSDAFAILWDGKDLHGLNASGRSPAGWTPERFGKMGGMPDRGWETVTVPGAVGG